MTIQTCFDLYIQPIDLPIDEIVLQFEDGLMLDEDEVDCNSLCDKSTSSFSQWSDDSSQESPSVEESYTLDFDNWKELVEGILGARRALHPRGASISDDDESDSDDSDSDDDDDDESISKDSLVISRNRFQSGSMGFRRRFQTMQREGAPGQLSAETNDRIDVPSCMSFGSAINEPIKG